jgi:hypothetical protein
MRPRETVSGGSKMWLPSRGRRPPLTAARREPAQTLRGRLQRGETVRLVAFGYFLTAGCAHLHVTSGAWERAAGKRPWEPDATALDNGRVACFDVCAELAQVGFEGYGILEFLREHVDNREWIARDTQPLIAAAASAAG